MMTTETLTAERRAAIEKEIDYRNRIQAELDAAPEHMKQGTWGIDRRKCVERMDREIARMEARERTIAETLATRTELHRELVTAGAHKAGTEWYTDRVA